MGCPYGAARQARSWLTLPIGTVTLTQTETASDLFMPVLNRIAEFHEEIAGWRRDFHAHPELLYDVVRTAGVVEQKLRGFGCDEVVTGIGRTGVVGIINGRTNGSGRTIGLRADMDALPMTEKTGKAYASTL